MTKGIDISVAAETKSAMSALQRGVLEPLEDIADALDTLGTESKRSGEDLERSMRNSQRKTADAADEMRTLRDEINRAGRASNDLGTVGSADLDRLGAKGEEIGSELRQNLGETFSSFKGDLADLPQIAQDTLGGLAGSGAIGGIAGLAVTAAGAAGLGLITATIQAQQEEAQKLKERMSDAYSGAAAAGLAYIDTATIVANTQDLMFNTERADEWKKVQDTQKQTGLEMSTILKANAGDLDAVRLVMGRVDEVNRAAAASGAEANLFLDAGGTAIQQLAGYWENLGEASQESHDRASDSIRYTTELLLDEINTTKGVTVEVDALGNSLYKLPNGREILIDAKTGAATEDVARFKGDVDGIPASVTTSVVFKAETSEVDRARARLQKSIEIGLNIGNAARGTGNLWQ